MQWAVSQHMKQLLYVVHLLIHNHPDLSVSLQILQHLVVVTTQGCRLRSFGCLQRLFVPETRSAKLFKLSRASRPDRDSKMRSIVWNVSKRSKTPCSFQELLYHELDSTVRNQLRALQTTEVSGNWRMEMLTHGKLFSTLHLKNLNPP